MKKQKSGLDPHNVRTAKILELAMLRLAQHKRHLNHSIAAESKKEIHSREYVTRMRGKFTSCQKLNV